VEFGLFSNGERTNKIAADSYDDDLYEIVVADKLGFREAWISEHIGHTRETRVDKLSVSEMFIAKAAGLTRQIRMGPGVRPLALYHPVQVATDAAVCDHLTRGRYMAGFGVGGLITDPMQQRGFPDADQDGSARARMHEAVELILRCWSEPEPFNYEGEFFTGKGINVIPKPFQQPRPPVGVAISKTMGTVEMAGRNGFWPIFSQNDEPSHMREMGDTLLQAAAEAGRPPRRSDIRACRFVWVSESVEKAKEELRPSITPSVEHHKREYPFHYRHHMPASGRIEDVTFDHLVDSGHFFVGDPDTVCDRIKDLYDRTGGFGVLLLVVGKDYGTPRQRARSMRLFMERVAPRLKELDPDRKGELQAVF
jgi:alkanesulfonate monooxygenase SsuD/methylene tetrahydromethanopterin reductase-like flavin-dependent oxidoreductase (luciferase family)